MLLLEDPCSQMGDAAKAQLHDAIAKLMREKQLLESQVKSLLSQKLQLEKSLVIESDGKKVRGP